MRSSFFKLSTALAATLFALPAMAADAIEAPPAPPIVSEPIAAPIATWSGFYAGASLGYTWGQFDTSIGDVDAEGVSGLGFAGYNFQSGAFVYGVEGDLGYSDANQTAAGLELEQGVFGSLRGRVGYAFDPVLIYGTAGVAATEASVTNGAASDSNTHFGWTAGVGADALITENIFGRLEYRYTDYETKDFNAGGTAVSSGFTDNSVRAGIGIKF